MSQISNNLIIINNEFFNIEEWLRKSSELMKIIFPQIDDISSKKLKINKKFYDLLMQGIFTESTLLSTCESFLHNERIKKLQSMKISEELKYFCKGSIISMKQCVNSMFRAIVHSIIFENKDGLISINLFKKIDSMLFFSLKVFYKKDIYMKYDMKTLICDKHVNIITAKIMNIFKNCERELIGYEICKYLIVYCELQVDFGRKDFLNLIYSYIHS